MQDEIAIGEPQGNEARIWGPPGCGKTTYLSRQVGNAAKKYGPNRVMVTSFTRAAATEIAGRDLPIPPRGIGTLHSHCYRALGCPEIAEAHIAAWNKENPVYRLSRHDQAVDEMFSELPINKELGDELYSEQQWRRARQVPRELWSPRVRAFDERWTDWKIRNGLSDFTDLLERGRQELGRAPGNPAVILVDEAQDLNPLQLALVRNWGRDAEYLVIAGDDDQTIYGFAGAAPDELLEQAIEQRFRHVLSQSYRVPRFIHAASQAWIQRVARREPKEYLPRDADGELRLLHRGNHKHPEPILDDAERCIAAGKTVMILVTCSYMLEPVKAVLRKRGLPFHNPYRRTRTDWNPLHSPEREGTERGLRPRALTACERLIAFLRPHPMAEREPWRPEDMIAWTAWLKAEGVLVKGAFEAFKGPLSPDNVTPEALRQFFTPTAFDHLAAAFGHDSLLGPLAWWMENLKPPRRRAAEYPVRVIQRGGIAGIRNTPQIIIGTGHSVKGGEADVVYLLPDLSPSGSRNWEGRRAERDALVRLGYVMMTRARESLVICDPAGPAYMPIAAMVGKVKH